MNLKVIQAGSCSYLKGLEIQKKITEDLIKNSNLPSTLLLLEHPPTYTIGQRVKDFNPDLKANLIKKGAEFHESNRGGLITFHGSGQLVAYPIINLKQHKLGVRDYVCSLESVIINLLKTFDIESSRTSDTGVWINNNRKIAAIGIHVSKYITNHGMALNCNNDLSWFDHIIPCGILNKSVTSISKEMGVDVCVDDVVPKFILAFESQFIK